LHDHNYSFYFYQNENGTKYDVKIDGPEKMVLTVDLNKREKVEIGIE